MPKTVVITSHGKVDSDTSNTFDLPINMITCSRFGEYHSGKLLKNHEVSIFDKPEYLYKYVLDSGENYTNKGKFYSKGEKIPNIILTPLEMNDSVKMFSWQKPYIITHLTKLCRYELSDNSKYSNEITPFNINNIALDKMKQLAQKDQNLSLDTSLNIINQYEQSFKYETKYIKSKKNSLTSYKCSFTVNPNKSIIIIDYEKPPLFQAPEITLKDFLNDIDEFSKNEGAALLGEGIDSFILKACLSE